MWTSRCGKRERTTPSSQRCASRRTIRSTLAFTVARSLINTAQIHWTFCTCSEVRAATPPSSSGGRQRAFTVQSKTCDCRQSSAWSSLYYLYARAKSISAAERCMPGVAAENKHLENLNWRQLHGRQILFGGGIIARHTQWGREEELHLLIVSDLLLPLFFLSSQRKYH